MIFEELSLEYYLAGRPLPWNKTKDDPAFHVWKKTGDNYIIKADLSKAQSQSHRYFNLKNW